MPTVRRIFACILGFSVFVAQAHAQTQTRPRATNYQIPSDVQAVGGGESAKSTNYILDDTIGEANIGESRSNNYQLDAGYRQTLESFLALSCSTPVNIGTITFVGQQTGSGACTVITDAEAGYTLSWASSGASLVSAGADQIGPFTPSVANTPETWGVGVLASEWGARLRSASTDSNIEWGTDGVSEKWLNVRTTSRTIVTRTSRTSESGSVEIVQFRAEVGNQAIQPSGTYQTIVIFTAASL
jgi:hypothetical protein